MSAITKEFTKEQLIEQAKKNIEVLRGAVEKIPGSSDAAVIHLKLAEITLASLEAEPAGIVRHIELRGPEHPAGIHVSLYSRLDDGIELYTAPPAPVSVLDLTALDNLAGEMLNHAMNCERRVAVAYTHCAHRLAEEVRDLRAAMLHGADTELQRKAAIHDALCEKYNVESLADFVDWQRNHIAELEAAPPAPVGKGETAVMPDYPGYALTQRECFDAGAKRAVPDGWVAVPIEPTYQMCDAMGLPWESPRFPDRYKAMIAAAPQQEVK